MRILVTGGSGLMGGEICVRATARGHEVLAGFMSNPPPEGKPIHMELPKPGAAERVRNLNPELIIHTGGLTDVDRCETEPELSERVNGIATGEIAKAARIIGAHLTYVSTDYVFDGELGNYAEDVQPNSINQYGRTKLMGERLAGESGCRCCVARTSVIYGWGRSSRPNYALYVVQALEGRQEVRAAEDLYSSPTLNTNLAEMLLELATRQIIRIVHTAGATRTSRLEFARALANSFDLDSTGIIAVNSRTLNLKAARPRDSSLDVSKATRTLNSKPMMLPEALQSFRGTRA